MKRVKKPVFFIIAALILALTYTSVFGVYTQNGDTKNTWIKGAGDIRWGIDIRGGVEATFSPAEGVEATAEQLEAAKAIIELRMVSKSITDYEIYTDEANDKIIVRFPWKSGESDFDPEKAIEEISATALLTFREGKSYETQTVDGEGNPVYQTPTGTTADTIILEGSDVTEAKPVMQENSTSGSYEKYFEQDDVLYHHLLDPKTGYPAESGLVSVTVVAKSGVLSDALSTACFVLGREDGMKLLEEFDAEGIFINSDNNITVTDGLKDRFTLTSRDYTLVS